MPEARDSSTSDKGRGKNGIAPSKHFFYRATTKGNRVFIRAYRIFCGFSVVIVILLVQEAVSQLVLGTKTFLLFRFRALSVFLFRSVFNCGTAS